jgi:hypothetical protein
MRFLVGVSNQPRHQPTPAVTTSTETIAVANASFSASRRIRRAITKKIAARIARKTTIATGVIASTSRLATAYCLLPFVFCNSRAPWS